MTKTGFFRRLFQSRAESPAQVTKPSMTNDNRRKAEERTNLISAFGLFMELTAKKMDPGEVADISSLPFDKTVVTDAICLELVREPEEHRREALKAGALFLANFQKGVGKDTLKQLGFRLPTNAPTTNAELLALANRMAADNPTRPRWEAFRKLVEKEEKEIWLKIGACEQVRLAMPEDKRREILG